MVSSSSLIPTEIEISTREEKKLKASLDRDKEHVSIRVQLCPGSKKILLLTLAQIERIKNNKRIIMHKTQLSKNKSYSAGFLVSLLSALAVGISTALVEHAISSGSGLYLNKKRNDAPLAVMTTQGEGLFLNKRTSTGKNHTLFLRRNKNIVRVLPHSRNDTVTLFPDISEPDRKQAERYNGEGLFMIDRKSNNIYVPTEVGLHGVFKVLV